MLDANLPGLVEAGQVAAPDRFILRFMPDQAGAGIRDHLQAFDHPLVGLPLVHERALADRIALRVGLDQLLGCRSGCAVGGEDVVAHCKSPVAPGAAPPMPLAICKAFSAPPVSMSLTSLAAE